MFNNRALVIVIVLGILAWVGSASLYTINETERGIKLRFGEIVENDIQPGLHFKWPILNTVRIFDTRVLSVDASATRYLTSDSKAVIVDSFVKWQIIDPGLYYEATRGNEQAAERLIAPRTDEALRNKFGQTTLTQIVRERPATQSDNQDVVKKVREENSDVATERDELMVDPISQLDQAMRQELGVRILDIRVKRIELPSEVTQAVYERMNSQREQAARGYRAEGTRQAEEIMADADRQRQELLASGRQIAETTRGEGDAAAAAIYSAAYQQNAGFFDFYRTLQAYRESFKGNDDLMVLSPASNQFLQLFKQGNGETSSPAAP
ncbi:protease modulator HflC [Kushneria indalinina]|uniref:Protein HflC n=1 Tax=Kushneria indalinina DSM 14324 TaxID=1122140 RepID=A0A3D9DUK9_9GAMM|nr:protease modulator HflC [Kushneria indalinina]REC94432.1 protease FtsH subunit HflC [Kushneria indalinina DSM 14324]